MRVVAIALSSCCELKKRLVWDCSPLPATFSDQFDRPIDSIEVTNQLPTEKMRQPVEGGRELMLRRPAVAEDQALSPRLPKPHRRKAQEANAMLAGLIDKVDFPRW